MAIWKCKCGSTEIEAYEWEAREVPYNLDASTEEGWDLSDHSDAPGHEPNVLMFARCAECDYELTDDELAQIAKSIDGLVLSGHPHTPINPNNIKGYVIVNPVHYSGVPVVLGWDYSWVWPKHENQLRQMFVFADENDNEHLYVGMVIPVTSFEEIADKYKLCEECGEVYDPKDEQCSCREEE